MRASALLFPLSPIFVFSRLSFIPPMRLCPGQLGKEEEESGTCTRSKIGIWKGRTWPEAYARCVREITAARIQRIYRPPYRIIGSRGKCTSRPLCASVHRALPCWAPDGRDIVDDTLARSYPRGCIHLSLASLESPSMRA